MAQIKKILFPFHFDKLNVLIEDTNVNSTYFGINNFPNILPAGKSYFLIGGSSYLRPGSDVQVEILDANGDTIFYEIPDKLIAGTFRLISTSVYSTTPTGMATVIVVGEASTYIPPGSTTSMPVPSDWVGKPNVRWSRQVKVDTLKGDTSEAILKTLPSILMTEIYDESRSFDVVNIPVTWQVPSSSGQGAIRTSFKKMYSNAPYYMQLVSSSFTKEMEGGIVHFPAPVSTNFGYLKPFDTQVTYIINEKLAQVSPSYTYKYGYIGSQRGNPPPFPVEVPLSEFTMSYVSQSMNTGSINKKLSYLHVTIKNLDTYGGVVKYVDIYKQPGNVYMGRWPVIPNEKITKGSHFESLDDFNNNWTLTGTNLWQVEMTTTASIEIKSAATWSAPTKEEWDSASAEHGALYGGLMYDIGQTVPFTNSLTINYDPVTKFFGIIDYSNRITKFTTYVYATASFSWSSVSLTYYDAFSIYVNDTQSVSRGGFSLYDPTPWSVPIDAGTNKINIYLENNASSYYLALYNNISQNGPIAGMNAFASPPDVRFDSSKLLKAIRIEQRID
jgi:hypothetical protein